MRWRALECSVFAAIWALAPACAPQIVEAVEASEAGGPGTGGSVPSSGGSNGQGGSGGVGGSGGGGACDLTLDRDGDGTPDCEDGCPSQSEKTAPGVCGCDLPDDDTSHPGTVSCRGLVSSLVHRYTFDGTGAEVIDSFGGEPGSVQGTTLTGAGAVDLQGRMSDQYVDLPNGIVSVLDSATFEAWLTWYSGNPWQRIFDFGDDQTGVEDSQGAGATYLFLTPRIPDDGGGLLRVAYQRTPGQEIQLDATRTLPSGRLTHVAVTLDAGTETLALYIDGAFESSKVNPAVPVRLSEINDINNWLGRSQYGADVELGATIEEFRIYSAALTAAQIQVSFGAGPNPTFF